MASYASHRSPVHAICLNVNSYRLDVRDVELPHGRATVIPHTSGVSRWLNDSANRALVDKGLARLAEEKARRDL